MLTKEILTESAGLKDEQKKILNKLSDAQKEALKGLTTEQVDAITNLSLHDEDYTIGVKTKAVKDRFDNDILTVTGREKPNGIQTHEHLKNVLSELKNKSIDAGKVGEMEAQIQVLKTERDNALKNGQGDELLKNRIASLEQSIRDKDGELNVFKTSYETEKKAFESKILERDTEFKALRLSSQIDNYRVSEGIKFNPAIPDDILKETEQIKRNRLIQSIKPDTIEKDGNKIQVLRDENGEILRNPDRNNEPYTIGELYTKRMGSLLDTKQVVNGAGTKPKGGEVLTVLDLSNITTQVVADKTIDTYLMTNEGLSKLSAEFQKRKTAIRNENKVAELPIQ